MSLSTGEKIPEFTQRHVSDMYYNAELENEIRKDHPERIDVTALLSEQRDKTYIIHLRMDARNGV